MKKRTGSKRTVSVKAFVAILALVLALGCAAGGTFAWLTAQTQTVTNTFTYGDINITLAETTGTSYTIIPGVDISKNPKVTVKANSEDCWLFVKVEESGTFVPNRVTWSIADDWTKGDGTKIPANVYYRQVSTAATDTSFDVIKGNKIYVSEDLTKTEIGQIAEGKKTPTLAITAYAVQKDGIDKVEDAWAKVAPAP